MFVDILLEISKSAFPIFSVSFYDACAKRNARVYDCVVRPFCGDFVRTFLLFHFIRHFLRLALIFCLSEQSLSTQMETVSTPGPQMFSKCTGGSLRGPSTRSPWAGAKCKMWPLLKINWYATLSS